MAQSSRRRSTVKEAIVDVLRHLDAVPSSPEASGLRAVAEEFLLEAGAWSATDPPAREKERLMRRVLELHLQVAKLERGGAGS